SRVRARDEPERRYLTFTDQPSAAFSTLKLPVEVGSVTSPSALSAPTILTSLPGTRTSRWTGFSTGAGGGASARTCSGGLAVSGAFCGSAGGASGGFASTGGFAGVSGCGTGVAVASVGVAAPVAGAL